MKKISLDDLRQAVDAGAADIDGCAAVGIAGELYSIAGLCINPESGGTREVWDGTNEDSASVYVPMMKQGARP